MSARLGPRSRLLLITTDGTIVACWRTLAEPEHVHGEWVSPYPDLVAVVDGLEMDADHVATAAAPAGLTLVHNASRTVDIAVAHPA